MKLSIEIEGDDWPDLELAVDEVLRLVREQYLCGTNRNDTGSYRFDVEGEPTEQEDEQEEAQHG